MVICEQQETAFVLEDGNMVGHGYGTCAVRQKKKSFDGCRLQNRYHSCEEAG